MTVRGRNGARRTDRRSRPDRRKEKVSAPACGGRGERLLLLAERIERLVDLLRWRRAPHDAVTLLQLVRTRLAVVLRAVGLGLRRRKLVQCGHPGGCDVAYPRGQRRRSGS